MALIPHFGMNGAALALLLHVSLVAVFTYFLAQRVLQIGYSFRGTARIVVLAMVATFLALLVPSMSLALVFAVKLIIVTAFVWIASPVVPSEALRHLRQLCRSSYAS